MLSFWFNFVSKKRNVFFFFFILFLSDVCMRELLMVTGNLLLDININTIFSNTNDLGHLSFFTFFTWTMDLCAQWEHRLLFLVINSIRYRMILSTSLFTTTHAHIHAHIHKYKSFSTFCVLQTIRQKNFDPTTMGYILSIRYVKTNETKYKMKNTLPINDEHETDDCHQHAHTYKLTKNPNTHTYTHTPCNKQYA